MLRTDQVIRHEVDVVRRQLARNRVELIGATASFHDANTVKVDYVDGRGERLITAEYIVIATGTEATMDPHIPFDGRRIITSDDILRLDKLPRTLAVVGAGVVGCEYASMFAALGVRVTLIDKRPRLLPFVDSEIVDTLTYHLRENRVTMRLNEEVSSIEPIRDEHGDRVIIHLESGKQVVAEKALYSIGRTGNTTKLNVQAAGLPADDRGRLKVNEHYQTEYSQHLCRGRRDRIPEPGIHLNGAGPAGRLPRIPYSRQSGSRAVSVRHLHDSGDLDGRQDRRRAHAWPRCHMRSARRCTARLRAGRSSAIRTGCSRLFSAPTPGSCWEFISSAKGSSELVHIGQAVLSYGGKIDYFVNTVFNYPTLAECYKTAAFDGINRMGLPLEETEPAAFPVNPANA